MWNRLIYDITEVINKEAFINLTIKNNIDKINKEEKKLYTKIMYGVVENKKWLDYLLRPYVKGGRFKPLIKNTLRIGVYTLSYLNLAPFYVVDSLVKAIKKQDFKASKAINVILRSFINDNRLKLATDELETLRIDEKESIIYNIDEDILKLIKKQYPNAYKEILQSVDESFNTYRINFLKTTHQEVIKYLDDQKIEYIDKVDGIITKQSLVETELFANALIIPQDLSSMEVAKTLNPPHDVVVLDTCSAPGSKSFHMASLMENTGKIISCDIYEHKLELIKQEAKRQGITNIEVMLSDASTADYKEKFKYILVDAPCSGMGTMKHKGDLKLRLTIDKVNEIKKLQKDILNNVINYLDEDGIMVYSTCTINKDENEYQIKDFLKTHPDIMILDEKSYLPSNMQDGFYICKLKRKVK